MTVFGLAHQFNSTTAVSLASPRHRWRLVTCEADDAKELARVEISQMITASGRLGRPTANGLTLTECRIVSAEPWQPTP